MTDPATKITPDFQHGWDAARGRQRHDVCAEHGCQRRFIPEDLPRAERKVIKGKAGLLELAKQPGGVTRACRVMGYCRDSLNHFRDLYEKGGDLVLAEITAQSPT
jgi:hypothetical protein